MIFKCTYSLLRRACTVNSRRAYATATAQQIQNVELEPFRTTESYPSNHDVRHWNRIYTVPTDITKLLIDNSPNEWKLQVEVFGEFGILVRKPALEIISYLENTDYTKSINKYVLFGKIGTGKTTTLLHLIHYGLVKDFIIIHVPWVNTWFRFPKETVESIFEPGKLDLPLHASSWLKYFKHLNAKSLSQLTLTVSKDYVWSQRESTKCGDSITDLINFGTQRAKFACAVIKALIDELKTASTAKKCRTLVIIDGYNAFTSDYTSVRDDNRVYVPAERISLTSTFMDSVSHNWCNGAAILSVDTKANKDKRESEYPRYLLGKKGFEHLDPFLPVHLENYEADEFKTVMDYYKDRKWIREITQEGQKEIELLSNRNPQEIWECCKPL